MKTILVCNQKGGVGKTLCCDLLCDYLIKDGIRHNMVDLDQQLGSLHDAQQSEDAAVTVVDTPGALLEDTKTWMESADLIIIPTLMGTRDIPALERMIDIAMSLDEKKPILIILNRWNHYNISKSFMEWFEDKYPELRTAVLSDCTAFNQAAACGESILEFAPRSKGAQQFAQIYGFVKTELNLKEGWR